MAGLAKALTKLPRKPYRSKATAQKEAGIGLKPKSPAEQLRDANNAAKARQQDAAKKVNERLARRAR